MEEKPPPYYPSDGYQTGPVGAPCAPPLVSPPQPSPPGYHTVIESALPSYGSTVYVHQQTVPPAQVIFIGGCPACRIGVLEDDFTCLGVCLAILFFPIGILCCLALRQRRCPNCKAIFG